MTIIQAIQEADNLRPNMFDVKDKINWLSRLDLRIKTEIFDRHVRNDGESEITFSGYGPDDRDTELLVGEPWAEMYVHWLEAQIDYYNAELDSFNASNAMFESVFSAWANDYHAKHAPKSARKSYF